MVARYLRAAVTGWIDWNKRVSQRMAQAAHARYGWKSGLLDFRAQLLPSLLRPGLRVLDVGGGKHPAIQLDLKRELGLEIVGLDIDADELAQARPGAYDATIVGDVCQTHPPGPYDLIVSRMVLEHVPNPQAALANLAAALAPGGVMIHVVPCAWAPFAIANRLLGNGIAKRLLFAFFPERRGQSGFPAYYRDCLPSRFARFAQQNGLVVDALVPYYASDYGSFFVPFFTLELGRQLLFQKLGLVSCCEVFTLVARRPDAADAVGNLEKHAA